jgi:methylmalonyl-CoA/ethylmalonyl-CoA epimerase
MSGLPSDSSPFAAVCQIGMVVRNMDAALEFFRALGLGPFESSSDPAPIVDRVVHGRPAPDVKNRISTTRMGAIELELVQPLSGESVQKEFLDKQGEGINHLGFYVEDLAAETAKLVGKGFRVVSSGRTTSGGAFAYFGTDRVGGILFELMQRPPQTR